MSDRFGPEHLEAWRRDGGVSIQNFFTPEEVSAVQADFRAVFGTPEGVGEALVKTPEGMVGRFHPSQFKGVAPVPLDCSPALNLIGVHPALIAFAKQALRTDKVHVYQCQAWAKFTGESDYDQPFHTDYSNHTLTAPSEDAHLNSVTILCYFSDVTEAHGPMHYVTRPDSEAIAGPHARFELGAKDQAELQLKLRAHERSSAAPAGSVFPYTIDVYHRGTNLTAPNGHRYALMTCFKTAGDESIGFHAWAFHHDQPWARIFDHASPEQLECFGVHPPGHPFWTATTLKRAQARYPNWDMTPYRAAAAVAFAKAS
jgi:hypothetical protein